MRSQLPRFLVQSCWTVAELSATENELVRDGSCWCLAHNVHNTLSSALRDNHLRLNTDETLIPLHTVTQAPWRHSDPSINDMTYPLTETTWMTEINTVNGLKAVSHGAYWSHAGALWTVRQVPTMPQGNPGRSSQMKEISTNVPLHWKPCLPTNPLQTVKNTDVSWTFSHHHQRISSRRKS